MPTNPSSGHTEESAYVELINKIDQYDPHPETVLRSVINSSQYEELMADWLGVEITSLFLADSSAKDTNLHVLKFLHEAVRNKDNVPDFPMYKVDAVAAHSPETKPYKHDLVNDPNTIADRRTLQSRILESENFRLTAELCAKRLSSSKETSNYYLIISFGEIIAHCFLFRLLSIDQKLVQNNPELWNDCGLTAWTAISKARSKSRDTDATLESAAMLEAVSRWYAESEKIAADPRTSRTQIIRCIYSVNDVVNTALQRAKSNPDEIGMFLKEWAKYLYESFASTESNANLEAKFWQYTLINPIVEEKLCSRGLYFTVVRSRVQKESKHSPSHEVYAICTLYDTTQLGREARLHLDVILRKLSHYVLAQFDFEQIERDYKRLEDTVNFVGFVGNQLHSWRVLMEKAARLCYRMSDAQCALLCWSDVGACKLHNSFDENKRAHVYITDWYSYLGAPNMLTRELARKILVTYDPRLRSLNSPTLESAIRTDIDRIADVFSISGSKNADVLAQPFGDKNQGVLILWLTKESRFDSRLTPQMEGLLQALTVGMRMTFRNAIGRGLLSSIIKCAMRCYLPCYILYLFLDRQCRRVHLRRKQGAKIFLVIPQKSDSNREITTYESQTILDWSVASIAEIAHLGYLLVATLFLASVFTIIYYTFRDFAPIEAFFKLMGDDKNAPLDKITPLDKMTPIIDALSTVEHTLMAFSICLAATGVSLLLKPGMETNLPSWMRRFAELGTLEKTLVRLVAMVLTIDVLTVVLQTGAKLRDRALGATGDTFQALFELFKPSIFHLVVYIIVLAGLALLSKFLLGEEKNVAKSDE